jgi:16S rRNA U516 pseudouridylate synthase RsuA-like enzyme
MPQNYQNGECSDADKKSRKTTISGVSQRYTVLYIVYNWYMMFYKPQGKVKRRTKTHKDTDNFLVTVEHNHKQHPTGTKYH